MTRIPVRPGNLCSYWRIAVLFGQRRAKDWLKTFRRILTFAESGLGRFRQTDPGVAGLVGGGTIYAAIKMGGDAVAVQQTIND